MERIGEVLEVFSTAFVELRKAHAQFCEEMALEKPPEDSLLQTTENPRALLAYLLNPGKEGSIKVTELSRALADFAVHQVALVSAVVQGARDMLEELSPDALAGAKSQGAGRDSSPSCSPTTRAAVGALRRVVRRGRRRRSLHAQAVRPRLRPQVLCDHRRAAFAAAPLDTAHLKPSHPLWRKRSRIQIEHEYR